MITHPELVKNLCKPGIEIADDLNQHTLVSRAFYFALEQSIMYGTRLDLLKKAAIYNKPLSMAVQGKSEPPTVTAEQAHILHMLAGILGEVAELADELYNHIRFSQPISRTNLSEEFGDIEFYLEGLRQGLDLDRQEILNQNIAKLSARYSGGTYSDRDAQARADKTH